MLVEDGDLIVQMFTWNALSIESGHHSVSMSSFHFQASDLAWLILAKSQPVRQPFIPNAQRLLQKPRIPNANRGISTIQEARVGNHPPVLSAAFHRLLGLCESSWLRDIKAADVIFRRSKQLSPRRMELAAVAAVALP